MKNLKKIAALVIVLAMALSTVAFAFTDVAEDAGYYEAVEVMSALGLLKGYEDGTFGPDKTITRAEFAAVVVRALGMEDAAAGAVANTMFTDVTSSHWAAGYVQIANQQGIIAGYGDGTFGPEDEVTYEQAVKMIVCALGYGVKFVGVANAYPSAYLSQANTSGITVGAAGKIGEKATRAIVAKLVYNALDVKLMEQTGFGSEEKFEEVDKTLLSSKLNTIKVEATVEGMFFNPEQANEVEIAITKMNKIYATAIDAVDGDGDVDLSGIDTVLEYAEGVKLQKGYNCVAYLDVSEDDYVIKAMVPKAGKNATLVLTGVQTKDSGIEGLAELKYYKTNSDVESTPTKIKTENVKIYENKDVEVSDMTTAEFVESWNKGEFKEITLIDNGNDNKYDYIYVSNCESWVVNEIVDRTYKIFSKNDENVQLDPEDEDNTFAITDINGKELAFADIKVGDVLNIFESKDADGKTLTEVIVTNETVEGTITEYNSVTGKYTIGDKEYAGEGFTVGEAGKFTVDMYGNIVDYSIDASNRKFGMIYTLYLDETGVDEVPTAMILTADGKFESYTFAKKVDFNGGDKELTRAEMVDMINGEKNDVESMDVLSLGAYVLNSSNEITKLYTAANISKLDKDYKTVSKFTGTYDADLEKVEKAYVVDSSVILTVKKGAYTTEDRTINYAAASKSYFVDEEDYTIEAITEDKEIIVAMVFGASAKVDKTSMAMYVTGVSTTTDSEGDDAIKVKGYVDGELVSVVIPNDVDLADGDAIADIEAGSMIQFLGDAEATAVDVLVAAADIATADGLLAGKVDDMDEDYFAFAGKVKEIAGKNTSKTIYFADKDNTEVSFKTGMTAMVVRKNGKVFANDLVVGDIDTFERLKDKEPDDKLIIYMYDGEPIGAIIYDANDDTKI